MGIYYICNNHNGDIFKITVFVCWSFLGESKRTSVTSATYFSYLAKTFEGEEDDAAVRSFTGAHNYFAEASVDSHSSLQYRERRPH